MQGILPGSAALAVAHFCLLAVVSARADTPPAPAPNAASTWLRCGALWDGRGGKTLGPTLVVGSPGTELEFAL